MDDVRLLQKNIKELRIEELNSHYRKPVTLVVLLLTIIHHNFVVLNTVAMISCHFSSKKRQTFAGSSFLIDESVVFVLLVGQKRNCDKHFSQFADICSTSNENN